MSYTQIERNIIKALGEKGPMGVATLMPLVQGLEGKAQLINVLEGLAGKHITKKQSNSQWVILKSTFAELKKSGELETPTKEKPPAKKAPPATPEALKDIPSTKNISAPGKATTQRKTTSKPTSTDLVRELMSQLPAGASLGITPNGITLFWNQVTLEPSTDELDKVMQSINCLQKHVA